MIYMLGFDLSEYDEPINNIYKGTKTMCQKHQEDSILITGQHN